MKNKDFFYLQYNKIDWKNQEETEINSLINNFIIDNVVSQKKGNSLSLFDMGFGIGFFMRMLSDKLKDDYENLIIEGCEPSESNFNYFLKKKEEFNYENVHIKGYKETFQDLDIDKTYDFITSIYVFPHILSEGLEESIKKSYLMLNKNGKFVVVVAEEDYLMNKLKTEEDLFIEKRKIEHNGNEYKEFLHYTEIPEIGTVVDYNREEQYYIDVFSDNGFSLEKKENVNDNGFISTLMVFSKE